MNNLDDYKAQSDARATSTTKRIEEISFLTITRSLTAIGLVAGILLSFQSLLEAAQARHAVGQLTEFKMETAAFRMKYGYLPGDIPRATAKSFGMFAETGFDTTGHQDGNGLIEGGMEHGTAPVGETLLFWRHLVETHLTGSEPGLTATIPINMETGLLATDTAPPLGILPKMGGKAGFYWIAYSAANDNYLQVLRVSRITHTGNYELDAQGMSPDFASSLDTKVDDGDPVTGLVRARGLSAVNDEPSVSETSGAGACLKHTAANATPVYDSDVRFDKAANACSLRVKLQ